MERRRRWAASGALPPSLACRFTLAEQSALAAIAAENRKRGDCRLTNGELADVAGVSITTVKNALREAQRQGLARIEERRVTAWRNAPNVVTITAPEWASWLRMRRKGWGQIRNRHVYRSLKRARQRSGIVLGLPKGRVGLG